MKKFVITSFGDRRVNVKSLYDNIRKFFSDEEAAIYIVTNFHANFPDAADDALYLIIREPISRGDKRWAYRSGDFWPIKFMLECPCDANDVFCLLDDDMLIMDDKFWDGFKLAERFGVALPCNPRVYAGLDNLGSDGAIAFYPEMNYMTAVNFSPMFVKRSDFIDRMFTKYCLDFLMNPCRGPAALAKIFWEFQYSPHILPETWCVCGENAEHIKNYKVFDRPVKIMCLHAGHKEVRDVFGV